LSSRSYFVAERRERKLRTLKYIGTRNKPPSIRQVCGELSFQWGISARKIREYIDELEMGHYVEITRGETLTLTEQGYLQLELLGVSVPRKKKEAKIA